MQSNELSIWEKLSPTSKAHIEPYWLKDMYLAINSKELRIAIAERLGFMGSKGWPFIHSLIKQEGVQPELIHAAGLCHQIEAKNLLIELLQNAGEMKLAILQALACWGADIPLDLLRNIMHEKSQSIRLAALELLSFKAHLLGDNVLLEVVQEPLNDFRDPIVIATIRILQRRNGVAISDEIEKIVSRGSEQVAQLALVALGCIATPESQASLAKLSEALPKGSRKDMADSQLNLQYRIFTLKK